MLTKRYKDCSTRHLAVPLTWDVIYARTPQPINKAPQTPSPLISQNEIALINAQKLLSPRAIRKNYLCHSNEQTSQRNLVSFVANGKFMEILTSQKKFNFMTHKSSRPSQRRSRLKVQIILAFFKPEKPSGTGDNFSVR